MKKEFRLYLSKARISKGYSLRRLARNTGIHYQHIVRIENGDIGQNVTFRVLCTIAAAIDIPAEELIKNELDYQNKIMLDNEQR